MCVMELGRSLRRLSLHAGELFFSALAVSLLFGALPIVYCSKRESTPVLVHFHCKNH